MDAEKIVPDSGATAAAPAAAASTSMSIQRKAAIGSETNPLEDEVDEKADRRIMRMPESPFVQRKCEACEEKDRTLHRKPLATSATPFIQAKGEGGGTASDAVSQQIQSSRGGGQPMDGQTKNFMESRFGTDFSGIRIHDGQQAAQLSGALNAKAFTTGSDIYFNSGKYAPESTEGRHLLAHELTHTIQQNGPVAIQRSCTDGHCATCAGGIKTIHVTGFFRTRATRATMAILRTKINEAKRILRNCCINLLFDFNWTLLRGPRTIGSGAARADGSWAYPNDETTLGEGNTFSGARGIPMLILDDITNANGLTVSHSFDNLYTGVAYMVLPINGPKTRSIAHELGHVAGILPHATTPEIMDPDNSTNVSESYCNAVRAIAT